MKPNPPAKLTKGKGIHVSGLADTFNWVVKALSNLSGEKGVEVSWADTDHPKVRLTGEESTSGKVIGNKSGSVAIEGDKVFASATDSNVEVLTSVSNGVNKIEIGVYYV